MIKQLFCIFIFSTLIYSCKGPANYSASKGQEFKRKLSLELENNHKVYAIGKQAVVCTEIKEDSVNTCDVTTQVLTPAIAKVKKEKQRVAGKDNLKAGTRKSIDSDIHPDALVAFFTGLGSIFVLITPMLGVILSLVLIPLTFILGFRALRRIEAGGDKYKGRGLAIMGIVFAALAITVILIGIFVIWFFSLIL